MKLFRLVLDKAAEKKKLGKIERMKQGPADNMTDNSGLED